MKIQDFVVLDLETTGLSVKEDQILEIGAVKVQGGEVTASYETFVNPGRKVPERITELTGIRDEMIANAPDVETAVRRAGGAGTVFSFGQMALRSARARGGPENSGRVSP